MGGMVIDPLPTQLALETRRGNQVANYIDREPARWGDEWQMNQYRDEYRHEEHRPVGPSRKYNCHGLTFASRRTTIEDAAEVLKIIGDDEYVSITYDEVMRGDIVIYFEDGDAAHSGIVIGRDALRVPIVLSKWGHCHEVVHRLPKCPYKVEDVRYYRITT